MWSRMVTRACKADLATESLLQTLRIDPSIEDYMLDGGQSIIRGRGRDTHNRLYGEGDGCSTYTEALIPALRLTTNQCLDSQKPSFLRYLQDEHDISIPWIPFQNGGEVDKYSYSVALSRINELRNDFIEECGVMDANDYQYGLAKRIFENFIPADSAELEADLATWQLYAAMHIAGLNVSFAIVPLNPFGKSTPLHVAISVNMDNNESMIVDPIYNAFDMDYLPSINIDEAQALSIHYTQQALKARDAAPLITKALQVDPYNTEAIVMGLHVGGDVEYPLATFQNLRRFNILMTKNWISEEKE
jgi:hypothetical protein